MKSLGTYNEVAKAYNRTIQLKDYKLPLTTNKSGALTFINDGTLKLTMTLKENQVIKISIDTDAPSSSTYMRVFQGFEFGLNLLGGWINNYYEALETGRSKGVVKNVLADYQVKNGHLKVSLTPL